MPGIAVRSDVRGTVFVAAVLIGLAAAAAHAAPSLTERHEDYTITGRSAVEVRGQMDRLGPRSEDGRTYGANARSEIRWIYNNFQTTTDGCQISSADVRLSVVYVMPNWADRDSAPREVRDSWDRFLGLLMVHEQGHRDISMKVAEEFERDVLSMRRRYCSDVVTEAEERAREAQRALKSRSREYDERTRHGAEEGAVFP